MKEHLTIINHSLKHLYFIGQVRRKDDRPMILPMVLPEIDYELSYDILTRLMLSIRKYDIEIKLDLDISDEMLESYDTFPSWYIVSHIDEFCPIEEGWDSLDGE